MSKLFLISVIAAGCQSRFRNGMQFTTKPKQIEVDDSELAVIEADRHLQVKVLSEGADDVEVADNPVDNAVSTVSISNNSSPKYPISDTADVSADASPSAHELEGEPTPNPDTDTDTAALPEAPASETQSAEVPEAPADHLATITEAMRGLNLDMTAGKPTVYDLQALGLDISAKERDAAWEVIAAEYAASNV